MTFRSWLPAILGGAIFIVAFQSFLDWAIDTPLAIQMLMLYTSGQIFSMGTFWTLDFLSQQRGYRRLAPFFGQPDRSAFARKTDRVGSTVAFFGSWLFPLGVAVLLITGLYQKKRLQRMYENLHLALWRFAAVISVAAPAVLAMQILS